MERKSERQKEIQYVLLQEPFWVGFELCRIPFDVDDENPCESEPGFARKRQNPNETVVFQIEEAVAEKGHAEKEDGEFDYFWDCVLERLSFVQGKRFFCLGHCR